jgi:hypothetical protein
MMASLNLKLEERENLYYNKYSYRAVCKIPGAYYTNGVKNITEFKDKVESLRNVMTRWPVHAPSGGLDQANYVTIAELINYTLSFEKNDKGTIRREGNSITFYSNDLSLLKTAPSTIVPLKIYQAVLLPTGVKHFKRTVPAPFRVHFKEAKVNTDIKQDIMNYLTKTEGVEASDSLYRWLNSPPRWSQSWSSKNYYINYTDSSQLTMMHILFSEVIGKNYKLEQK